MKGGKQLFGPVEKKRSRRRKLLYPHPKLSLGLVPYRPLLLNRCTYVACEINDVLDYLCKTEPPDMNNFWKSLKILVLVRLVKS